MAGGEPGDGLLGAWLGGSLSAALARVWPGSRLVGRIELPPGVETGDCAGP